MDKPLSRFAIIGGAVAQGKAGVVYGFFQSQQVTISYLTPFSKHLSLTTPTLQIIRNGSEGQSIFI